MENLIADILREENKGAKGVNLVAVFVFFLTELQCINASLYA